MKIILFRRFVLRFHSMRDDDVLLGGVKKAARYSEELDETYGAIANLAEAIGQKVWLPSFWSPSKLLRDLSVKVKLSSRTSVVAAGEGV